MPYCTMNWETPLVCKRLAVKTCLWSVKVVILNKCWASSKLTKLLFNPIQGGEWTVESTPIIICEYLKNGLQNGFENFWLLISRAIFSKFKICIFIFAETRAILSRLVGEILPHRKNTFFAISKNAGKKLIWPR